MTISHSQDLLLALAAFVLVGGLTPVMRRLAIKHEVMDAPNTSHKTHKDPVPYLGGVGIIIGILAVSFGALIYKHAESKNFWLALSVLGPALVLGLIGLWDDIKNLPPLPRFIAQTIAGVFTSAILISSSTVGTPTGSRTLDAIVTTIWIVGICNSINFFDNLDGGAAGTIAISSIALTILGINGHQYLVGGLAAVTAGATVGFLLWNKSPARIYMGDAGALFLGILIASLTIRLHPSAETQWTSFATPLLLIAVPILDTSVAVLSRLRRKISPFQGGRDHLSHRLVRAGLERPQAAITLWVLSGFFALCAVLIPITNKMTEQFISGIATLAWVSLFIYFFRTPDSE
jgi:UDP-GlcNAc:undecaprenyl-phosphate/decaprenyl-phosphate GlcNAc-1-phosphate transferase